MNTEKKVFNKLFKEEKVKLAAEKVELSLREAESIIKEVKESDKILNKAKQSYKNLQKEAIAQASITAKASSKLQGLNSKLSKAFQEAKDIEKTMNNAGIPTGPLSSRVKEIQSAGNDLSNNLRELQELNNSFQRI